MKIVIIYLSFHTCMNFFILLNTKNIYILKNVGNQSINSSIDFHIIYFHNMEANCYYKQFGYQHS